MLKAANQARLDADRFQAAWHDPALIHRVQDSHNRARECQQVFGTPTLVLPNGMPYYLELSELPPETAALEVFRGIEALTLGYPYLRQLRRRKRAETDTCLE